MQCVLLADNAGVFVSENKCVALRVNSLISRENSQDGADAKETRNECCLAKVGRTLCVCASVGFAVKFGNLDSKQESMSSLIHAHISFTYEDTGKMLGHMW